MRVIAGSQLDLNVAACRMLECYCEAGVVMVGSCLGGVLQTVHNGSDWAGQPGRYACERGNQTERVDPEHAQV